MSFTRMFCLGAVGALLIAGCGETIGTPADDGGTAGGGGSAGEAGSGGTAGVGGTGGAGGSGGVAGTAGTAGTGGAPELCAGIDCSDANPCTNDATCNPANGACEGGSNKPVDTPCDDGSYFCTADADCRACNRSEQCPDDDGNECNTGLCAHHECMLIATGGACDFFGQTGVCEGGVCVDADLCVPYPCTDQGDCVSDACNPSNGTCVYPPLPANTSCNDDGGAYCDGRGNCVECTTGSHCYDADPCTSDVCLASGQCVNSQAPNGSFCTARPNVCIDGVCTDNSLGRLVFSGDRSDLYWAGSYAGIYDVWSGFQPWGLAGFYLNFTGSGVDREMERMTASWVGTSTTTVLYARLEDDNGDDGFTWRIDSQQLPYGSERYSYADCNNGTGDTTTLRSLPSDKVPVLLGFDLDRSREDKVERIFVELYESQNGGVLVLSHGLYDATDVSSPGPYCARVDYALIPAARVVGQHSFTDPSTRHGIYSINLPGATRPILQGFRLEFTNGDHNIDQVGVRMEPGKATIWFNDKNDDDPFTWRISWADLQ